MAELTKTQVSEKVKKALDWIVADSTTKANNAKTQAINDAASRYLPLAGGTMSGTVATHATCGMRQTSNDQFLEFFGGTQYNLGAFIRVDGKDSLRKGSFHVEARNDNGTGVLEGTPEGVLTWQSKNIVRSVNGINADAAGNVAIPGFGSYVDASASYTAPSDGFYLTRAVGRGDNTSLPTVTVNGVCVAKTNGYHGRESQSLCVPVAKGDVIVCTYSQYYYFMSA